MRIGLAYNQKPDAANSAAQPSSTNDAFAEWDDPSTIAAVEQALGLFGSVVRLEADQSFPQQVLVETFLPAPEFTVAILGNGAAAYCLPVIGFDFSALPPGAPPVYGYEAKWVWDRPEAPLAIFQCPALVPAGLYAEIERTALDAYQALGCRDWCRVDIRVDRFGVPNILELNPLPRIIPDPAMNSCFPKAARAAGFGYDELIQEVVRISWRRLTGRDIEVGRRAVGGAQHGAPLHAASESA